MSKVKSYWKFLFNSFFCLSVLNAINVLSGSRKGDKSGHLRKAIWPFVTTAARYCLLFNWKRMQEVCGALKKQSLEIDPKTEARDQGLSIQKLIIKMKFAAETVKCRSTRENLIALV